MKKFQFGIFGVLALSFATLVKIRRRQWWEKPENFLRVFALQCRAPYRTR